MNLSGGGGVFHDRAHNKAVDIKCTENSVPGDCVCAAVYHGIPDGFPVLLIGQYSHFAVAVGTGVSGVMVGRACKTKMVTPSESLVNGISAVPRSHIVIIGISGCLIHGAAMLGADLYQRSHAFIKFIPVDSTVSRCITDVVGDRNRSAAAVIL